MDVLSSAFVSSTIEWGREKEWNGVEWGGEKAMERRRKKKGWTNMKNNRWFAKTLLSQ